MKYYKTLALIPALLLAACGGDEQTVNEKTRPGLVVYSYPADGQADVSPKADIVLRFSHAVTAAPAELEDIISVVSDGTDIPFGVEAVDGGKSLKLSTNGALEAASSYSITFKEPLPAEGGRIISTPNAVGDPGIQFDTRGSFSGTAQLANTSGGFDIAWQVPANNSHFQAMNFSTFRFAMTQPVHPQWQEDGTIELLDSNGDVIPATVLVKGNRITVDPCVTDDPQQCGGKEDILNASETYTLKFDNLASLTSDERFSHEYTFTPRETGPTVVLKQSAVDSENGIKTSVLNGAALNSVTLNSVLQGTAGPSQQGGDLFAELGFAPAFKAHEAVPLRIPKGSVLESTSLNVKVGGEVQVLDAATGEKQETGTIKVTMLSDASGYMSPNQYTDDINAPRHITLFMDVSMNTEEAQPNAALSQNLMGVELRGIALVQDGVLTIDAIGMVEPSLLGQEYTDSTIAFHLQAATDATSALDAEDEWLRNLDTTPPSLVSWMPGAENAIPATRQSMHRPGDPVILFFDEPLDPASIEKSVTLTKDGAPVTEVRTQLDGTALTIKPKEGFVHGSTYSISVNGISDLAGNTAALAPLQLTLEEATFPPVFAPTDSELRTEVSPVVLTSNAGFPCATTAPDLSIGNLSQGQCLDGAPGSHPTDNLPIIEVGSDQPLSLVFSHSMDPATMNADTIKVERVAVDSSGTIPHESEFEPVTGRYQLYDRAVKFFPNNSWSNDAGIFYRYTLITSSSSSSCNPAGSSGAICSTHGMPLNTSPLVDPLQIGSPHNLVGYFKGGAPTGHVMTPLHNVPVRDVNSNYWIDNNESFPFSDDQLITPSEGDEYYPTPPNAARLTVNGTAFVLDSDGSGWFGCDKKGKCPDKQFIYKTAGLLTEVVGPVSDEDPAPTHPFGEGEEDHGIRVLLHPAALITTGAELHLEAEGASISGLILSGGQNTGPQVLRMRYAKSDPSCEVTHEEVYEGEEEPCKRDRLIEGRIIDTPDGPKFRTKVDLFLDAPKLTLPVDGLTHNLFSYPFTLDLEGDITFFDDGRMQIEQRNLNPGDIRVSITFLDDDTLGELLGGLIELINVGNRCTGPWYDVCYVFTDRPADDPDPLAAGAVSAPLQLPPDAVYLNYMSYPVKDLPAQYSQQ